MQFSGVTIYLEPLGLNLSPHELRYLNSGSPNVLINEPHYMRSLRNQLNAKERQIAKLNIDGRKHHVLDPGSCNFG